MQQINIITIGKIKNSSLKKEIDELKKRISRLNFIEIKEIKNNNVEILKKKEEEEILKHINPQNKIYILHEHGKQFTTFEFSNLILKEDKNIDFIITGAYGPSNNLIDKFTTISLSPLTFTHEQAQYMLVEQIYRAQCVEKNIPYTK